MIPDRPQFQPGNLVRLTTGGPVMTLKALSGPLAYCVWTEEAQARQGTFELALLRLAAAPPTPQPAG